MRSLDSSYWPKTVVSMASMHAKPPTLSQFIRPKSRTTGQWLWASTPLRLLCTWLFRRLRV